jgi:hypothetical protein
MNRSDNDLAALIARAEGYPYDLPSVGWLFDDGMISPLEAPLARGAYARDRLRLERRTRPTRPKNSPAAGPGFR